ncbi:MAG: hypothetical protein O9301_15265 [Leptospira sp.]|nr:hypothetical protein [Leptospira sp.]
MDTWRIILLKVLKTKSFILFFVFFLLYKCIFNVFTADLLVPKLVKSFTIGSFEGKFKRFSLFFGIEIHDVKFFPGAPFQNNPILSAKKIVLHWNLPALVFGKLKISEVGLRDLVISIEEKEGISNLTRVLPPKKTEEEVEVSEDAEPTDEISTYLPLQASAYINLDNISLSFISDSETLKSFHVSDLSLELELVTNRFTSIPLNLEILEQLDYLSLKLNKEKPIPISLVTDKVKWNQTIPLSVNFEWDRTAKPELFLFTSNFGQDNILMEVKNKPVELGFHFFSDINYKPETDLVEIKNVFLKILGTSWFTIQGKITDLSKDKPNVDIKIVESKILLSSLQRSIDQLKGIVPEVKIAGDLSLLGTEFQGNWTNIKSKFIAKGNAVSVSMGKQKTHNISYLDINLVSEIDLSNTKIKSKEIPFPQVQKLEISPISLNYNGADLGILGRYTIPSGINLEIHLQKFELNPFVSSLNGRTKADISIFGENLANLNINLKAKIDNFRYALDRSRSPFSNISAISDIQVKFAEQFKPEEISIQDLKLEQRTTSNSKALQLGVKGKVQLSYDTNIRMDPVRVDLSTSNLLLVLPLVLKEKVAPIQSILGESPSLSLKLGSKLSKESKEFSARLFAKLPGLEVNDLSIDTEGKIVGKNNETISLKKFDLYAFDKILHLKIFADLKKSKLQDPPLGPYAGNISLNLNMNSKVKKYLLKGISFQGDLGMDLNIKDFDILGSIKSSSSAISYTNSMCPGENCKVFLVDGIKSDIPIQHSLNAKPRDSLIVGDKSIFLKTYGRDLPSNFSINQVVGTHPSIPDLPFEYVKKQESSPGFSANIQYKENFLSIESLRAYSLNGIVLGKNMLFNLSSMAPQEMEFRGNILVRDIDLKQLMAPKIRDKIDDGKIKADLNISLRDFSEPLSNLDLFFSIFQIGKDFGKSALNVISQQNILIDRIADSYSINKIEVSLSKGLVYADVLFRRSLLSLFINLEDSKISQQRMPLANFLKRAQSEIESYQE